MSNRHRFSFHTCFWLSSWVKFFLCITDAVISRHSLHNLSDWGRITSVEWTVLLVWVCISWLFFADSWCEMSFREIELLSSEGTSDESLHVWHDVRFLWSNPGFFRKERRPRSHLLSLAKEDSRKQRQQRTWIMFLLLKKQLIRKKSSPERVL